MKLMLEFMQSMWRMHWFWRLWIALLMLVNAVIPLFYLGTFEAQLVLLVFMLAAMTQMIIFHRLGFVRLLGIGHIYWIPMLAWLWSQDYSTGMETGFMTCLSALILLNGASLLIDTVDVTRYWRGERQVQ